MSIAPNLPKTRQAAVAALMAFSRKEITTADLEASTKQLNSETRRLQAAANKAATK